MVTFAGAEGSFKNSSAEGMLENVILSNLVFLGCLISGRGVGLLPPEKKFQKLSQIDPVCEDV